MRGQTCLPDLARRRLALQLGHSLRSCCSSWLLQSRRRLSCRTRWGSGGSSRQGPAYEAAASLAQVLEALQAWLRALSFARLSACDEHLLAVSAALPRKEAVAPPASR